MNYFAIHGGELPYVWVWNGINGHVCTTHAQKPSEQIYIPNNVLTRFEIQIKTIWTCQYVACLPFSCRHATISKFFGDQPPNCAGACDYCSNPKGVRAQLEAVCTTGIAAQSKEPRRPFGFDPELYGGSKKGYGFERQVHILDTDLPPSRGYGFGDAVRLVGWRKQGKALATRKPIGKRNSRISSRSRWA